MSYGPWKFQCIHWPWSTRMLIFSTQHKINSWLIVGLGWWFGFLESPSMGYTQVTIPFIRGFQESKPPTQTNNYITISWTRCTGSPFPIFFFVLQGLGKRFAWLSFFEGGEVNIMDLAKTIHHHFGEGFWSPILAIFFWDLDTGSTLIWCNFDMSSLTNCEKINLFIETTAM